MRFVFCGRIYMSWMDHCHAAMHLAALSLNSFVQNAADNIDLAGLEEENTTLDVEVLYRVGSDAHALCLVLGSLEADPGIRSQGC